MEIFKGESIITFFDTFKIDLDCLEYLAQKKWDCGFSCRNVVTQNVPYARRIWHETVINVTP